MTKTIGLFPLKLKYLYSKATLSHPYSLSNGGRFYVQGRTGEVLKRLRLYSSGNYKIRGCAVFGHHRKDNHSLGKKINRGGMPGSSTVTLEGLQLIKLPQHCYLKPYQFTKNNFLRIKIPLLN
jgi:hypothetical protein